MIVPGTTIHVTFNTIGLDAISNLPDMPCRVAIVTGEPSSVSGLTPVHVMPPYTSAFNALLDVDKVDSWHPVEACHRVVTGFRGDAYPLPLATEVILHDR